VEIEIVELGPADVQASIDDLARLLLDAHDSNMALGLTSPLTPERARLAWVETAESLDPDKWVLLGARDDEGAIHGAVQIVRAATENGTHRAEIQRLAVRSELRGQGLGRELLEAAVERARTMEVQLLWLTTHADTDADAFYERCGWTRLGVMPSYSERPDGELVANAFFYLEP
jgi:GNAT superfamily N-acetyltransferase